MPVRRREPPRQRPPPQPGTPPQCAQTPPSARPGQGRVGHPPQTSRQSPQRGATTPFSADVMPRSSTRRYRGEGHRPHPRQGRRASRRCRQWSARPPSTQPERTSQPQALPPPQRQCASFPSWHSLPREPKGGPAWQVPSPRRRFLPCRSPLLPRPSPLAMRYPWPRAHRPA